MATITTATSSGDWGDAIWDNGSPGCFDTIVIPAGIQVDVTTTVDLEGCPDSMVVLVEGKIEFQNGKKIKFPCFSDVYISGGGSIGVGSGGGNSTYIEICSNQYWNASSGDLTGPALLCDGGCGTALPIQLINFNAHFIDDDRRVELKWSTASESENDYFTIERSKSGQDWTGIGQVDGAGNSSITLDYMTTDEQPLYGTSYYRLKQTDMNGEYSYTAAVRVNKEGLVYAEIYPNPVSSGDNLIINFPKGTESKGTLNIFSVDGKLVYEYAYDISDTQQIIINIGVQFEPGMYLLKSEVLSARIVVR